MPQPLIISSRRLPLLVLLAGVLAGVLATSAVRAADPTIEQRLAELEGRFAHLESENADLRTQLGKVQAAPADKRVVALPAGKETELRIGGYLHIQGEAGGSPDSRFVAEDRFYLRRARLRLQGKFGSDYDFTIMSDFGNNSLSAKSGASAQLADLFVRWKKFPEAIVTVGQFKTPFGYDQLMADTKTPLIERPLTSDKLTASRQIGVGLSGAFADGRLNYATGIYNGNKANNGFNDNDQFMYVGRLDGTVVKSDALTLNLGVNAYTSDDTGTFTGTHTGYGVDAQVTAGAFGAIAEYLEVESDPVVGASTAATGWSILGSWMVVPKKFEAVARYENYDPKDTVAGDDTDLWSVGGNYFLMGNDIKLSVNYLWGETRGVSDDRVLARLQLVY